MSHPYSAELKVWTYLKQTSQRARRLNFVGKNEKYDSEFLILLYSLKSNKVIMATTITIKEDTKKVLATLKGNKDWDSFLKELAFESGSLATRRELIRKRLEELFVEETRVRGWAREY